jgi:hypothetical protein
MKSRIAWIGLLVLGFGTVACVGQAKGPAASPSRSNDGSSGALAVVSDPGTSAPSPRPLNAVGDIASVSRSNPGAAASAALKLCGVDRIGIEHVARMGEIPSARDAARYVPLRGVEPELQTDASAWLIVFSGKINLGHAYWAQDPICAVIDGTPTMFEPGPYGRGDTTEVPPTPQAPPTLPLPALTP